MQVRFQLFKSALTSWDAMCKDAAQFASTLERDRLISISLAEDAGRGVIVVWYWG